MFLNDLSVGKSAKIVGVGGEGALRQHFLDMGVIPGAEVTVIKLAPLGDPMELQIHGYELSIRMDDAAKIEIEEITSRSRSHVFPERIGLSEHPGIGEEGRYHIEAEADPLPEGARLSFALVGNQNCGKTTLFNALTGSNQHVGNFPGVTVDRKSGSIKGYPETILTDLPGIYSMSPYSIEEIVSRNYVLDEHPTAIINILDATNIARNLYLTMQLLELGIPMVIALNMMDEVYGNGGSIDINALEEELGVPVVPISASKGEGIEELVGHAIHIARNREKPRVRDFCDKEDNSGAVHRCIHSILHLFEDHAQSESIPLRFAATKAIEGDELIIDRLKLDNNEKDTLEHIVVQMEKERGLDRSAAIADMRFEFIEKLCEKTVVKPRQSKEKLRSERIDRILTGKYTAIPAFVIIMMTTFFLTFNVIGSYFQSLRESLIGSAGSWLNGVMTAADVNPVIHSLVMDGVITGVGSVVSFLPIIVTLFFFLSVMEDSGYIARVAFVMDKLLRKIGLSGKSIVPLLIGFGCTVPAVMATRTLPSMRDRKLTVLLTPFMSCTAKLPIYAFFVNAFFPGRGGLIMTGLYVLSIIIGIGLAFVSQRTVFKGGAAPFVMELPNYRLPGASNVIRLLWEKAKDFLQRAFSVILIASIAVWVLQSFDTHLNLVSDSSDSILALISSGLAGIMAPIGLGDWRICTALISGFMAKESVVSTLQVLVAGNITQLLVPKAAASMLVFSLLYTPCVAAVASIRRELGTRWAAGVVVWQCVIAWIAAWICWHI